MHIQEIAQHLHIPLPTLHEYCSRLYGNQSNASSVSVIFLPLLIPLLKEHKVIWKEMGMCRLATSFAYVPRHFHNRQQNSLLLEEAENLAVHSEGWTEVAHCRVQPFQVNVGSKGTWFYVSAGSGVSINVGKTAVANEILWGVSVWSIQVQQLYRAIKALAKAKQMKEPMQAVAPEWLIVLETHLRIDRSDVMELDSIQILHHQELDQQELHEVVFLAVDGERLPILNLAKELPIQCGRFPSLFPCSLIDPYMSNMWNECIVAGPYSFDIARHVSDSLLLDGCEHGEATDHDPANWYLFILYVHPIAMVSGVYLFMILPLVWIVRSLHVKPVDYSPKWTSQVFVCLAVLTQGGVIYGVQAMLPILYAEGLFESHCLSSEGSKLYCERRGSCCDSQQSLVNSLMTMLLFLSDSGMLVSGQCYHRIGPRVRFLQSTACFGVGIILIGVSSSHLKSDLLSVVGLAAVAASGPGVLFSCLSVCNETFRANGSCALVLSMWSLSAGIPYIWNSLYFLCDWSLNRICLAYGVLAFLISLICASTIESPASGVIPKIRGASPVKLIVSILVFMSLFNLQSTFYLTSLSEQLHEHTWRAPAEQLVTIFRAALPIGGIVGILASKIMLSSRLGEVVEAYLLISISIACVTSAYMTASIARLPVLPPHPTMSVVLSELMFGPTRSFVWVTYYHFVQESSVIPDYIRGRLLGYGNLFIAGVSGMAQLYLNALVHKRNDAKFRRTDRYAQVDVCLATSLIAGYAAPLVLYRQSRTAPRLL